MAIPTPVSYWNLDEISGNATDAVDSNTLTNANVTYQTGKLGNGALFNSSSDKLSITDASQTGLDIVGDLSISSWIKLSAQTTNTNLVNKWSNTSNQRGFMFYAEPGYLNFDFTPSGTDTPGNYKRTAWTPTLDVWYHVGVVFTASTKNVRFFVDGVQLGIDQTTTNGSILNSTASFCLGIRGSDSTQPLAGMMDMVGIWNVPLTDAEMGAVYNSGVGVQYPFPKPSFLAFM